MLLRLGYLDRGCIQDPGAYLADYHDWNLPAQGFRDERNGEWQRARPCDGAPVRELQTKLREIGFYTNGKIDGVYAYRTVSGVRLFQEYVHVIDGAAAMEKVDGIAGRVTQARIEEWITARRRPAWRNASPEYKNAMAGLRKLKASFGEFSTRAIDLVNQNALGSATRKVSDWTYDEEDIHLIGIRRNVNRIVDGRRNNDDLFILLVNGMRMVFRGSTNPDPRMGSVSNKAFLLCGQHEYRFGWHRISGTEAAPGSSKVYRGFKPRNWRGPLVVRGEGALLTDRSYGEAKPNPAINIHWSGSGTSNWSAGCQVIAGKRYIDFRNELVDLDQRAARSYTDLSGSKTRGAYNVLVDAMTLAAKDITKTGDTILYTLLSEEDARKTDAGQIVDFEETIARLS